MWNPFGKLNENDVRTPPEPGLDPASSSSPKGPLLPIAVQAERARANEAASVGGIAEVDVVGAVAIATITTTELTAEIGAEQLAVLLLELAETGARHFVLDMSAVQYMDSACLGCLVESLNQLSVRGGRIALANSNQAVNYMFRLTRLDRVFQICSDVMSAIEKVESHQAG